VHTITLQEVYAVQRILPWTATAPALRTLILQPDLAYTATAKVTTPLPGVLVDFLAAAPLVHCCVRLQKAHVLVPQQDAAMALVRRKLAPLKGHARFEIVTMEAPPAIRTILRAPGQSSATHDAE
jgi:hypothetical protein